MSSPFVPWRFRHWYSNLCLIRPKKDPSASVTRNYTRRRYVLIFTSSKPYHKLWRGGVLSTDSRLNDCRTPLPPTQPIGPATDCGGQRALFSSNICAGAWLSRWEIVTQMPPIFPRSLLAKTTPERTVMPCMPQLFGPQSPPSTATLDSVTVKCPRARCFVCLPSRMRPRTDDFIKDLEPL
jgi:hypothetical protein